METNGTAQAGVLSSSPLSEMTILHTTDFAPVSTHAHKGKYLAFQHLGYIYTIDLARNRGRQKYKECIEVLPR